MAPTALPPSLEPATKRRRTDDSAQATVAVSTAATVAVSTAAIVQPSNANANNNNEVYCVDVGTAAARAASPAPQPAVQQTTATGGGSGATGTAAPSANLRGKKTDDEKSVSQLVNERKREGKKKTYTDEALMEKLDNKYIALANRDNCKYLLGSNTIKCNCLDVLDNRHYRKMVSKWTLGFLEKPKHQQDQQVMEWIRYAHDAKNREAGNNDKNKYFLIPYDNSEPLEWDDRDDGVGLDMKPLLSRRVCTSAIMEIVEKKKKAWPKLVKAATTTMIVQPHGNIGKKRKREDEDLVTHFTKLEGYGEVEATRFMRTITGQLETRDNDDKDLRLPTHMSKRNCYREYGKQIGYEISKDEIQVAKWTGEGEEPKDSTPASWTKYRGFWNENYPHLKVGVPSEDICTHCHQFSMRHRYAMKLKDPSQLNKIDDALFNNINNADEGHQKAISGYSVNYFW